MITGANSDIGIEVCKLYLADGYRVIAHYRNDGSSLKRLQKETEGRLIPYQADFANPHAVDEIRASDSDLFGATDVLVYMAALREPIPLEEVTSDDLLRHFTVNVIPYVLFMQWLGTHMAKRGWGRIVNISSIGVKFGGGQTTFCYSMTKHAAEFVPAVHKKWAASNVFVNAVRLGVTQTRYFRTMPEETRKARIDLIPAKRMAEPEEMAKIVHWLGSESNTFMTGQVISPSGGE